MNNIINTENNYVETKDKLISLFNDILEGNKRPNIFDIDNLRKISIAIKAFDLVSFSMSMFAFINYKTNKLSYYKTLAILNDAKYLAASSHSAIFSSKSYSSIMVSFKALLINSSATS